MIERRAGSIIIISSIGGLHGSPVPALTPFPRPPAFQLARNLAVEFGPHNVRVNCLAPGLVKTDFARALWEIPRHSTARCPRRRSVESDSPKTLPAGGFFASDEGSYVTGQVLVVDGSATIA
jgi:NAD(P)-dependent dehydrogenase (short-subunit alcohol dehydrogenase family)